MARRRHEFEEGWKKQLEQEMEEMKRAFEKERDILKGLEDSKEWWQRDETNKSPIPNQGKALGNAGNVSNHPSTELDVYAEILKPDEKQSNKHRCGWFSRMGWDGKQIQHASTEDIPSRSRDRFVRPRRYPSEVARYLEPFDNSEHTIPYILLSSYSPLYLCNPSQCPVVKVRIQDAPNVPLEFTGVRFNERAHKTALKEDMARQLPWADAFEDLVSLQQTGKMIDRDYSTYRTPPSWIHDMVYRGSLGSRWGFNDDGDVIKKFTDEPFQHKHLRGVGTHPRRWKRDWLHEDELPFGDDEPKNIVGDKINDRFSPEDGLWPSPGGVLNAIRESERVLESATKSIAEAFQESEKPEIKTLSDHTTSSQSSWSSSSSSWSTYDSSNNDTDSIVSTLTSTESRTLPDGSIETRKVLKKRFADGREESNESVEIQNGPKSKTPKVLSALSAHANADKQTQTPTPVQDQLAKTERRGGWFWK